MAELKKIVFKNKNEADPQFPEGYEPINAENLNLFQDNIEEVINEETTAMNQNADNKLTEIQNSANTTLSQVQTSASSTLTQIESSADTKLASIQSQVDEKIKEMEGIINADELKKLQTQIDDINKLLDRAVYQDSVSAE